MLIVKSVYKMEQGRFCMFEEHLVTAYCCVAETEEGFIKLYSRKISDDLAEQVASEDEGCVGSDVEQEDMSKAPFIKDLRLFRKVRRATFESFELQTGMLYGVIFPRPVLQK